MQAHRVQGNLCSVFAVCRMSKLKTTVLQRDGKIEKLLQEVTVNARKCMSS